MVPIWWRAEGVPPCFSEVRVIAERKRVKQKRKLFNENKGVSGSLFSDSFVESVKRVNPSAEFRAGKRKSEGSCAPVRVGTEVP